jgi:hypothetical protein
MYINNNEHYEVDEKLFKRYLTKETELLESWFKTDYLKNEDLKAGTEIEFLLLDKEYNPLPQNVSFIEQLNDPLVVAESGASQLEINTKALTIEHSFLSELHQNILTSWNQCCDLAKKNNYHLALIGSMPQAAECLSNDSYITPQNDFYLMNEYTTKYRAGTPLVINIKGPKEHLVIRPESLAIEGLICSFQLHLAVKQNQASTYYNIIQMLSAPLLALSSNAPFFYGKNTWSESRIAIFEQIYNFPLLAQKTVFFEPHYLDQTLFPIFQDNVHEYPYLVPIVDYEEPQENMVHVRRQNGCLFRWNRPILDFDEQHQPYLRIEHRALSSGPTLIDMVANAAFFYGIVYYFANQASTSPPITLKHAMDNFYQAAQLGLNAQFRWNTVWVAADTLLKNLLPLAAKGLCLLGINQKDIQYYLQVIERRLINKQNGSSWQQAYITKYGTDFQGMLNQYLQNQYAEIPIAEWKL